APSVQFTQFHPLKGKFGWWLQQNAGMAFNKSKNEAGNIEQTSTIRSVFAELTPGLYYAAGERQQWLLTATVGSLFFNHQWNDPGDFTSTAFGTSLFQNFVFGFAYVFRKGEKKEK
ncbi:MAG: hypothetical protein MUF24_10630, partial [Chitinophagaceae bacterium]|nr:hypothetical protein [Chitinophagaceae bacterium]